MDAKHLNQEEEVVMVVIRLSRSGTNKKPFYHVVVADHRRPRDGRYIERVGIFNPVARGQETYLRLDKERIVYWQGQGAQASERVIDLMKEFDKNGVRTGTEVIASPSARDIKKERVKSAKKADAAHAKAAESAEASADVAAEGSNE